MTNKQTVSIINRMSTEVENAIKLAMSEYGKRSARKLTAKERSERARNASKKRWGEKKQNELKITKKSNAKTTKLQHKN